MSVKYGEEELDLLLSNSLDVWRKYMEYIGITQEVRRSEGSTTWTFVDYLAWPGVVTD